MREGGGEGRREGAVTGAVHASQGSLQLPCGSYHETAVKAPIIEKCPFSSNDSTGNEAANKNN